MDRSEAAAWASGYADELERGGWSEDARRFRQEAAILEGKRGAECPICHGPCLERGEQPTGGAESLTTEGDDS